MSWGGGGGAETHVAVAPSSFTNATQNRLYIGSAETLGEVLMCNGTSTPTTISSCSSAVQTYSNGDRLPRIEVCTMQDLVNEKQHLYSPTHVAFTAGPYHHSR